MSESRGELTFDMVCSYAWIGGWIKFLACLFGEGYGLFFLVYLWTIFLGAGIIFNSLDFDLVPLASKRDDVASGCREVGIVVVG